MSARCKLWPLARWDFGFKYHQVHECLSLLSIVCWQLEVSVSGLSLIQRSPIEYDCETLIIKRPWPRRGYCTIKKNKTDSHDMILVIL